MPNIPAFYSSNETRKPASERVHHNNDTCSVARDIKAAKTDRSGTNGYPLCRNCEKRQQQGR